MEIIAQLSNARMTPRKVRSLRKVIVGLPVCEARAQLTWQGGRAAAVVGKVLRSAVANAQHNYDVEEDSLRVVELKVNEGMRFKRWRPVSRGMAHPFVRRTSHVTVVLDELQPWKQAGRPVSKQVRQSSEQADIDTLTVDDLARRGRADGSSAPASGQGGFAGRGKALRVFQKVKMQQQGGDKKKAYRRKSI